MIPLPDVVETVTGEEDEKVGYTRSFGFISQEAFHLRFSQVLFEERCKMYRFTDSQWKERATGVVKVLHNEKKGTHRVVMRRDQVLIRFLLFPSFRE